jgi:hypothetical protein
MPVRGDETVQSAHEVIKSDTAFDLDRQRGLGELIGDSETFNNRPSAVWSNGKSTPDT